MNLKGRNFLTLKDFTPEEITYMIDLAADLKAKKKAGELHEYYRGKNIALIFEKTSTRTRCSFEVAAHDLGMGSTYLDPTGSQIGKKESIADTESGFYFGVKRATHLPYRRIHKPTPAYPYHPSPPNPDLHVGKTIFPKSSCP